MVLCIECGHIEYARWCDTIYIWDLNPELEKSNPVFGHGAFKKKIIPAPSI